MSVKKSELLDNIAEYYSQKIATFGQTPQGVDWNSGASQVLRFEQLSRIFDREKSHFSVIDLGCGYGAFFEFLSEKFSDFSYSGFDVSKEMIIAAQSRFSKFGHARFMQGSRADQAHDYTVASGIFNVRLDQAVDTWFEYIRNTLVQMNQTSRLGFAFNCLTTYSDPEKMRAYLYYADPCKIFDLCKQSFSKNVALLHDYDLYEFTILVRKNT